jgi:hypothetical protein
VDGPDGTQYAGTVLAPPGTRAGRAVMVWVDAAGRLTGHSPLQLSQVRGQAALTTTLGPWLSALSCYARACWSTPC